MQSGRGKAPLNHPSTVNIDRGRGGQEATAPGGCSPHLSGNATKLRDTPLGLRIFCDLLKQLFSSLAVIFGTTKRKTYCLEDLPLLG